MIIRNSQETHRSIFCRQQSAKSCCIIGARTHGFPEASPYTLTVVRLTHINIYNGSNPEFIAKTVEIIRQTIGGIKIPIRLFRFQIPLRLFRNQICGDGLFQRVQESLQSLQICRVRCLLHLPGKRVSGQAGKKRGGAFQTENTGRVSEL